MVEKVVRPAFSTIFVKKTFSEIRGKSGKSCQNQLFPRLKPFWRPKSWKKLVLTTFSTIFMIPKTSSKIRGKSGKSWPGQFFPRLKPFWKPKSWKMFARTTFSTISMIPKTSSEIRGKSGKSCQNQLFPRLKPVLEVQIVENVGQANFLRVLPILSMLGEEPLISC